MSDALPEITFEIPRELTRTYFDNRTAFGHCHAQPATHESYGRTWDDDQLLDAAHVGARGRDLHPDLLIALCRRYIDMATAPDPTEQLRCQFAKLHAELVGERLERDRLDERLAHLIGAYTRLSLENLHLRHQIAGTTPVSVEIALHNHDNDTAVANTGGLP